MSSTAAIPNNTVEARVAELERQLQAGAAASASGYMLGDYRISSIPPPSVVGLVIVDAVFAVANGSLLDQTIHAAYFAKVGTTYNVGGEPGGKFRMPDQWGRVIAGLGTHTDVSTLAKNDAQPAANRTPKHGTSTGTLAVGSMTLTGAPGIGSLAISPNPHSHIQDGFTAPASIAAVAGGGTDGFGSEASSTTSLSITGAPDKGTLAVSGGTMSGQPGASGVRPVDMPAYGVGLILVRIL